MKKKKDTIRVIALTAIIVILFSIPVMFTGCAEAEAATTSKQGIIFLPDGERIEGPVTRVYSYSNGAVEITIDGNVYTTHLDNVCIIEE